MKNNIIKSNNWIACRVKCTVNTRATSLPYAPALWSFSLSEYEVENYFQGEDEGKKKNQNLHFFVTTKNYKEEDSNLS